MSMQGIFSKDLFNLLQYRVGQLFMIAKHSHEQSQQGEGVEVVKNEPIEDEEHGKGQFTEKRIHLSRQVTGIGYVDIYKI